MLFPSKTKYRKRMRGRIKGNATQGNTMVFGEYAIQATGRGFITSRQIESARVAITRALKRTGKVWIRIFPDKPITMRPAETRMGKGKGSVEKWVCPIKPGRVLFELDSNNPKLAREALDLARYKLSVKSSVITRGWE
jgi:large subunit ribosomal protein L16